MKRVFKELIGWLLLLAGLIGLMLPVVPQWPLIIPGLIILAEYYHWPKRLLHKVREKYEYYRRRYKARRETPGDGRERD